LKRGQLTSDVSVPIAGHPKGAIQANDIDVVEKRFKLGLKFHPTIHERSRTPLWPLNYSENSSLVGKEIMGSNEHGRGQELFPPKI